MVDTVMIAVLLMTILCTWSFAVRAAEPMTLESALALAYENNPALEGQRAALRATDENVAKSLAKWRPTVSGNGSYGWRQDSQTFLGTQTNNSSPESEQLNVTQPLFDGRTIPQIEQAKSLVDVGRAQLNATEQSVLFGAASAYCDVLRDSEIVELYHQDIDQLRSILKNAQQRQHLGELTRTDTSQASARLIGSQLNLAAAEQQLAISRAKFLHFIGRPAETLLKVELPRLPATRDEAMKAAREVSPTINQAKAQARAADHNVEAAYGALMPSLSLQAQYGRTIDQVAPGIRENGVSVIGQLTIPLYQAGAEEAAVRQAKEQRSQATLAIAEADRQVEEDVATAWAAFEAARQASDLAVSQRQDNETAFEGSKYESQVGARNTIDILNADQELLQSKVTAISQNTNALISAYQLKSAMGLMTAAALKLPVKLYDAQDHYADNASRWFGFGD